MVSNNIEVSDGSVTKYGVSKGVRWRWQAVATEQGEDLATNPVRLGKAGFATRKEARAAMRESLHHIKKEGFPQTEVTPEAVMTFGEVAADSAKVKATKSTKTYRQQSLDIDPETLAYLEGHMAQRRQLGLEYVAPSAFIFGTITNELRGPNDVTRRFSKMVKMAQQSVLGGQLPWVSLQGLRHGHATHLLEAAVQPKIVQERLGHSNIQTTMDIYSHVLPTIQRDALSVLMTKWAEAT